MRGFATLLRREIALAWSGGGGPLMALAFNACAVTLLPLAAGASLDKLKLLAPGFSWVALALASLLSLERLFERDYDDGALDLLALGPLPLELVAAAKCLAQWLCTGLPLALFAPIAVTALGADPRLIPLTFLCSAIGGLGFAFVGGIGAAVSLGARAGGVTLCALRRPRVRFYSSSSPGVGPTSSSSTMTAALPRTAFSISVAMAGLFLRNSRALSRP